MSGVCGVAAFGGRVDVREARAVQVARLSHRGGAAVAEAGDRVAVAALRWPLDTGGDLAANPGNGLLVVADSRLDNLPALVAQLDLPYGSSDAEVILAAYRRWGPACCAHFEGDFAFALVDTGRDLVLLGRDRVGVKQLYYHWDGHALVFATEIKAVIAVSGVPRRLNRSRLAEHLLDVMENVESTLFEEVRAVPPAHAVSFGPSGRTAARFWALDPAAELHLASDDLYAAAYREAFLAAVANRLRGPGRTGVMLSGGIDSSAIACAAVHLGGGAGGLPVPAFHAAFAGQPLGPDDPYADRVLAAGGFEACPVAVGEFGPLTASLDEGADDEPLRAPGLGLQQAVYAAARNAGCGAILDGDAGDDVVSHGLARLGELVRAGHPGAAVRQARALAARGGPPARGAVWAWGLRPLLPVEVLELTRRLRGRRAWSCALPVPLTPGFAESIDLDARLAELCAPQRRPPLSAREDHWRTLTSGLTPHALGVLDRAAARVGVEPRYPFLDARLMELCLSLPADQKLDGGWTRVVARRAMAGIVPDEVRWRGGKAPMSGGLVRGLAGPDRDVLQQAMEAGAPVWEFVDRGALEPVAAGFAERPDPADALILWLVASTDLWLRRAGL